MHQSHGENRRQKVGTAAASGFRIFHIEGMGLADTTRKKRYKTSCLRKAVYVYVRQRLRMLSRHPRSTYDTHFFARPRRVTDCSVTSGHDMEKEVLYSVGMYKGIFISPAYSRGRLKVCRKEAQEVGSRMHSWRAQKPAPLRSSGSASIGRAYAL